MDLGKSAQVRSRTPVFDIVLAFWPELAKNLALSEFSGNLRAVHVPFRLSLLPPWQLDGPGGAIDMPSRKARAIVAFLALAPGQSQTREALASLLWSDSSDEKARASLRQVLSVLNRLLCGSAEQLLNITPTSVGLDRQKLGTDINAAFDQLSAGDCSKDCADVLRALPSLLSDLSGVSPEYEAWVTQTVQRLMARATRELALIYEDAGQSSHTRVRAAQIALALDELDEEAVRALMSAYEQSGNTTAALRLYRDFYERIQDEMDAEPSLQTQDLAVRIKLLEGRQTLDAPKPTPLPAIPAAGPMVTVAVLPFELLGDTPAPDYVALGLLDQLTCQLAAYQAPAVISSNTTRRYMGHLPDLNRMRDELGATYVVSGSVLSLKDRTTVSVQLADCLNSHVVWADTFHCAPGALFDIRDNVAENIAHVIVPTVNVAELRLASDAPVGELDPYHLVLRAKDLIFRLDRDAFDQAGPLLSQAITDAPLFAPAHALLAEWHALRHWQGWGTPGINDRDHVQRHATRAISLAPGDGRAMALWGHCRFLFDHDFSSALQLFDTALSLKPNDSETLIWSAPALAFSGQAERAVDHAGRAHELSPLDPFRFRNEHFLSLSLYCNGAYDEAANHGLSSFARAPDYTSNLRMTIASLVAAGRLDETQALVAQHNSLLPEFSVAAFMPSHGLRDAAARQQFGEALVSAGLPN